MERLWVLDIGHEGTPCDPGRPVGATCWWGQLLVSGSDVGHSGPRWRSRCPSSRPSGPPAPVALGPGDHVLQTQSCKAEPGGERGREPESTSAMSGVFVTVATRG